MKKIIALAMAAVASLSLFTSCGTGKGAATSATQSKSANPFGETFDVPCAIFDTREKFAATGIYKGSSNQKGECHKYALENAKALIRAKYHHTYKGMISDYSSTIGNNRGNDITTKMEQAGDQVINAVLNDALESCFKFGAVQDDGMVECYVAIEIYKDELANKVTKKVADVLTKDEKLEIRFQEEEFRKKMEERMANYKDEHQ